MASSFQLSAYRGRTRDFAATLKEYGCSVELNLAAQDVVRLKIFSGDGATPDLEFSSAEPTANGSKVTFTPATGDIVIRVAQGDTEDMSPGNYDCEISVVDDSETDPPDAIKVALIGVFTLLPSGGGPVDKEESSSSSSS